MTPTILHHPSSTTKGAGLLLCESVIEQAALKMGIFGPQGSGKTLTMFLILLGLSIRYHNKAPIAFFDTESGSDFMKSIADVEGVQLLVIKSRAFSDMKATLLEAERRGCCGMQIDSYTHPWKEVCDTFKKKSNRNRLEFQHMDSLKTMWQGWTDLALNSPLHLGFCGRLAFSWDHEEEIIDGRTERTLVKLGTKMKGEAEAGYEPSLLVEMEAIQEAQARVTKTRAKRGTIQHHCYVLKDRWRSLNGKTLTFRDLNDYKPGDYETVFKAFLPHIEKLAIATGVQRAVDGTRTSIGEFGGNGDTAFQQLQRQKQIVIENLEGTFRSIWPGETVLEKSMRRAVIDGLFHTRSWTAVQENTTETLEHALLILQVVEGVIKGNVDPPIPAPETPEALMTVIEAAGRVVNERELQAQREAVL